MFERVSKEYSDSLVEEAKKVNKDHLFSPEEIDYIRSMADQIFQGKKEFTDKEFEDFLRDPTIFQETLQAFLDEQAEEEHANFTDNEQDEHEYYQEDEEGYQEYHQNYRNYTEDPQAEQALKKHNKLKSLFNTSNLNKLYKLLANRLHLDKEKNEHLKAEKSELMSTLVNAKKNKNAFTIISMFHQFMPESENGFFDGNNQELSDALITLLNQKSHELDQENDDEKYANGVKSMIWDKLNGRSKKATQDNINSHLADLEDSHTRLHYYINEVKTVVLLKDILSERYDQRNSFPFSDNDFSLEEIVELFK